MSFVRQLEDEDPRPAFRPAFHEYKESITDAKEEWGRSAACLSLSPLEKDGFYAPEKDPAAYAAIAVCRRCPVNFECLEYALVNKETMGIWGGATELVRKRLDRRSRFRIDWTLVTWTSLGNEIRDFVRRI